MCMLARLRVSSADNLGLLSANISGTGMHFSSFDVLCLSVLQLLSWVLCSLLQRCGSRRLFECFVLSYRTVAALLSAGADSCARDVQGYTGLHMLQKEYLGSGERLRTSSSLLQEVGLVLGVCMDVLKCTCSVCKKKT